MILRTLLAAMLLTLLLWQAVAQANPVRADKTISELMIAVQCRHIKMWFAGRLGNWPLAK